MTHVTQLWRVVAVVFAEPTQRLSCITFTTSWLSPVVSRPVEMNTCAVDQAQVERHAEA